MNGEDETCCLCFYYDKNPTNGYYEFKDPDSELDMADILGIDMKVCVAGETEESERIRRGLNDALSEFMSTAGSDAIDDGTSDDTDKELTKAERKALKKQRRQETLHQREAVRVGNH